MQLIKVIAPAVAGFALLAIAKSIIDYLPFPQWSKPRPSSPPSRPLPLTGPGRGMRVEVGDPSGVSHPQVVGRGVVAR